MRPTALRLLFQVSLSVLMLLGVNACNSVMQIPVPTQTPANTPATAATAAPTSAVEVWLTLPDQSKKLNPEPALAFQPGKPGGGVVALNADIRYQQMEGFGAAMTDSSAWLLMNVLSEETRQQVMQDLFTRQDGGIGLSYVRIPLGASDFALKDYTYDDMEADQTDPTLRRFNIEYDKAYILPALKLAAQLNPQLRFMGSPWSAPGWMKRGGRIRGGPLLPEYYQAFADYHVRLVQAYAAEGLAIDSITPQNEPLFSSENYPTMFMAAADQQTLVRDYLGPAFQQAGLQTRIVIFDHNWDLKDYPLEVLADPQAAAFIDGVAFHCYGGNVSSQTEVHQAHPEKSIWFTECSGGDWATNFGDNLSWNLRNLVIGNFRNWGNSVLLWNLALDENDGPQNGGCSNCRGVVTISQSSGKVTYNEEYYILGHVSKFVDPGAYRIDSTNNLPGMPENVAFLNPDGSLVLIVQSDTQVTFSVTWKSQHFTYTLPAKAAVTFKWR